MKAFPLPKNPVWVLASLFAVTAYFLLYTVDITVTDQAGVREQLPKTLGANWVGYDVLFCQDPVCGRSWLERDVPLNEDGLRSCPENWQGEVCGGELHQMARGEKQVLPRDTVMMKKQYFNQQNPDNSVFTSVVLSGKDRSSIHRPEVCMDAQGHVIEDSRVVEVPLENGQTLKVMVLLLKRKYSEQYTHFSYYAYFFIGKDRTTHLHFERLMWMSLDRVFRNVAHRWAYISVSGIRSPDLENTEHVEEIRNVIRELFPEISLLNEV